MNFLLATTVQAIYSWQIILIHRDDTGTHTHTHTHTQREREREEVAVTRGGGGGGRGRDIWMTAKSFYHANVITHIKQSLL